MTDEKRTHKRGKAQRGIVIVNTGKGKGKTTAALGVIFRAWGRGLRVCMIQFVKSSTASTGEVRAAKKLAIERATGLPVIGWLPRSSDLGIPQRHLGLVPTAEPGRWQDFVEAAAEQVSRYLDIERLLEIARQAQPIAACDLLDDLQSHWRDDNSSRPIIALARDEAFNFTYEENIDLLRAAGAEVAFFSPLEDDVLPAGASGVILSGGFPELYAERLSSNDGMRLSLQIAHGQGLPVYAECGGLMALTQSITDLDGCEHPMFALLPGNCVMTDGLNMGYRLVQAAGDSWLMRSGEQVRGHEFHYSAWMGRPVDLNPAYIVIPPDGQGEPRPEGARVGSLWASYVHLSFWNKPELALRFVDRCRERGTHEA